jgi:hypothetical protein
MRDVWVSILVVAFTTGVALAEQSAAPTRVADSSTVASTAAASNTLPTSITLNGTAYEDVRWKRATAATVTIFHRGGIATIPLAELPPDLQKHFGYDPRKAADYESQAAAAEARLEEQNRARAAAHARALQEKAERQATYDAIVSGGINVEGTIQQVFPNGALVERPEGYSETTKYTRIGDRPDAGGVWRYRTDIERHSFHVTTGGMPIFVLGPVSSFLSGGKWSSMVYPAGTYQLNGSPLKCFAVAPEDAFAYVLGDR